VVDSHLTHFLYWRKQESKVLDPAAVNWAENTEAARRSRERKVEQLEELTVRKAELEEKKRALKEEKRALKEENRDLIEGILGRVDERRELGRDLWKLQAEKLGYRLG
jgi:hypothetical protein